MPIPDPWRQENSETVIESSLDTDPLDSDTVATKLIFLQDAEFNRRYPDYAEGKRITAGRICGEEPVRFFDRSLERLC